MQNVEEVHDTPPSRKSPFGSTGAGVSDQVEPSHVSTMLTKCFAAGRCGSIAWPTATQNDGDVQDTAEVRSNVVEGDGIVIGDHEDPSQDCATTALTLSSPTATHQVVEV